MDTIGRTRLVHRLAWLLVALAWPLIWVGGLVTTYDAGMSVPDWPGTYGYNLLLYPLSTWITGPFDIFVEHGHRLLGMVVGIVAIALLIAAWRRESRWWVIVLCFGVLLAVIGQGVLGGMRVLMSDQTLAMVHGVTGPAFFALSTVAVVVTSPWWMRLPSDGTSGPSRSGPSRSGSLGRFAVVSAAGLVALTYLQLVLGALLRHAGPTTRPGIFAMITANHILIAFVVWAVAVLVWLLVRRCGDLTLSRPGVALVTLVFVQIGLGTATWLVNYGFPTFLRGAPGSEHFLIRAKGFTESLIVTGHVATGSLILAVATLLLVRALRYRHVQSGIASSC